MPKGKLIKTIYSKQIIIIIRARHMFKCALVDFFFFFESVH